MITKRPYGLGGSPNSTEALFTPDIFQDTLPFLTKPLAHFIYSKNFYYICHSGRTTSGLHNGGKTEV